MLKYIYTNYTFDIPKWYYIPIYTSVTHEIFFKYSIRKMIYLFKCLLGILYYINENIFIASTTADYIIYLTKIEVKPADTRFVLKRP